MKQGMTTAHRLQLDCNPTALGLHFDCRKTATGLHSDRSLVADCTTDARSRPAPALRLQPTREIALL